MADIDPFLAAAFGGGGGGSLYPLMGNDSWLGPDFTGTDPTQAAISINTRIAIPVKVPKDCVANAFGARSFSGDGAWSDVKIGLFRAVETGVLGEEMVAVSGAVASAGAVLRYDFADTPLQKGVYWLCWGRASGGGGLQGVSVSGTRAMRYSAPAHLLMGIRGGIPDPSAATSATYTLSGSIGAPAAGDPIQGMQAGLFNLFLSIKTGAAAS